jgi:hypothetical protein
VKKQARSHSSSPRCEIVRHAAREMLEHVGERKHGLAANHEPLTGLVYAVFAAIDVLLVHHTFSVRYQVQLAEHASKQNQIGRFHDCLSRLAQCLRRTVCCAGSLGPLQPRHDEADLCHLRPRGAPVRGKNSCAASHRNLLTGKSIARCPGQVH